MKVETPQVSGVSVGMTERRQSFPAYSLGWQYRSSSFQAEVGQWEESGKGTVGGQECKVENLMQDFGSQVGGVLTISQDPSKCSGAGLCLDERCFTK